MEAKSRQAQNTKVVRLDVKSNTQVESRRTIQHGAREAAKKTTDAGSSRIRVFKFRLKLRRIKDELARPIQRKLVAEIHIYTLSPRTHEEPKKRGRKSGKTEPGRNPTPKRILSFRDWFRAIPPPITAAIFQENPGLLNY